MNTIEVEHGPMREETMFMSGVDYYKPTMSQVQYEQHPDAEVTFTFKNRGANRIADYVAVDTLQERLNQMQAKGFDELELTYLASQVDTNGQPVFSEDYIEYLRTHELPAVNVVVDPEIDDLAIETTGDWPLVTYWETVVMGQVNEAYFEGMVRAEGLDIMELYDEGERRLDEKIALLQQNPDIKFSDFGNRRHFSLRWQKYVDERLKAECPDNFVGTSNVGLAQSLGLKPIGTFAHEMPMVYAGLADAAGNDIRASHNQFLEDWYTKYRDDLSIALTDTFGTDFFFEDFTPEQAAQWRCLRHDSGDPFAFGEKAIEFYQQNNIDPTTKTIVFSDGLDMATILELHNYFKGKVNAVFGWGTTLTNDLGVKALNIVMKATEVNGTKTVKLSDNLGKHTGPDQKVAEYQTIFAADDREQVYAAL